VNVSSQTITAVQALSVVACSVSYSPPTVSTHLPFIKTERLQNCNTSLNNDTPKHIQFEGTHTVRNQVFRSLINWKVWAGVANVATLHLPVQIVCKVWPDRWCRWCSRKQLNWYKGKRCECGCCV
jgi:hypothetical protein